MEGSFLNEGPGEKLDCVRLPQEVVSSGVSLAQEELQRRHGVMMSLFRDPPESASPPALSHEGC